MEEHSKSVGEQRNSQGSSYVVRKQFTLEDSRKVREKTTLSIRKKKTLDAHMRKRGLKTEDDEGKGETTPIFDTQGDFQDSKIFFI